MKIPILLSDDAQAQLRQMRAALVRGATDGSGTLETRAQMAGELFAISEFSIPGQAIQAISTGYRPALAIVDVDYQDLKSSYVLEAGFNPDEERRNLRGFDLLAALHEYSPETMVLLYTGKADEDEQIWQELNRRNMRLNSDYLIKLEKELGFKLLSVYLRDCFEGMVRQWVETIEDSARQRLREWLESAEGQANPLAFEVELGKWKFALEELLAFEMTCDATGAFHCGIPDIPAYLRGLFDLEDRISEFEPNGVWQQPWVHKAILDWRKDTRYAALEQEISADAANYLLYCIQCEQEGKEFIAPGLFVKNSNIGKKPWKYGDNPVTIYFLNALKTRRVLIGLSRMARESIWGNGRNRKKTDVLSMYMEFHDFSCSQTNMRNHISQSRGLGIGTLKINPVQSLATHVPNILEEEARWLERSYPVLLDKVRQTNTVSRPAHP